MSTIPKISVVMPTYNRVHLIRHAINGIIDQTFKEWELIIVDDGSTDDTEFEVARFSTNDSRIRYVKVKHTGKIGYLRNLGNKKALGELIVVQDSDDVSLPDRLDVLWSEYKRTKADVLYHAMYMLLRLSDVDMVSRQYRPALPFDKKKIIETQYIPGQIAYTKKAAMKIPYNNDTQTMDDWLLLIEMALHKMKFHPIQRALYEYWYTQDSVTVNSINDGRRVKDLKVLADILRKKYKVQIKSVTQEYKDLISGKVYKNEEVNIGR